MHHFQDIDLKIEELILLLQLIKKNGNIDNMIKQGYQYSQVAKILSYLIENNYAGYTEQGIFLSIEGDDLLNSLNKRSHRRNSEALISPQIEYKLDEKKSVFDVYLPNNHKDIN